MKLVYSHSTQSHQVILDRIADQLGLELDGAPVRLTNLVVLPPRVTFIYQDKPVTAFVIQSGDKRWVHVNGKTVLLTREQERVPHSHSAGLHGGTGAGIVIAPMPGQVRGVLVQVGERVTEGRPLFVLEAMKMELKVLAPYAGVVVKINVTPGSGVERDQILGELEEQE